MTAQEALGKIRVMLGLNEAELSEVNTTEDALVETTEVKLASTTLLDGTIVETEGDFEVGKQLVVVTEEGEKIPAPEGQHETTDGFILSVDAEGIITSIDEVVAEEEVETELSDDIVNQLVNALKPSLEKIDELSKEVNKLKGEFHAFRDEPAGAKVYNNLNEYTTREQDLMTGRVNKLIELRRANKLNK